jgi:hypothetical protein
VLTKARLLKLYSRRSEGVNAGRILACLAALALAAAEARGAGLDVELACSDPELVRLFTPLEPQLGRYEVCTASESIDVVAPRDWQRRQESPLDALGSAGAYNRSAVRRLYGSRAATVARGWVEHDDRFESITMISPYPDARLARLATGTLVIRLVMHGGARGARLRPADR